MDINYAAPVMIMLLPMTVIIGLVSLTLRALKAIVTELLRSWRIAIGGLVPILPFWCGFLWEDAHAVILLREPNGSVGLDEGWLILTQLLFVSGSAGLVVAPAAAMFFTRRAGQERWP